MLQTQKAGWNSRGWMSFTIANGGVLHLGGTSQTVPTLALSGGKNETDPTCFLVNGIPQISQKTRFASALIGDTNGHEIKHAIVTVVSAGATTPAGRSASDGSVPTTTNGAQVASSDSFTLENRSGDIFNFKIFNRSGGNMVIEVEPFS